jgi:hypothetical protein
MGLHCFFAGCNSARIFFVILNSLQIVLGLLRLQILEESNDGDLIVLNEFGYLESPKSWVVLEKRKQKFLINKMVQLFSI